MYKQAEFEDEDSSSIGSVALNSEGISTSATHIRYNSVSNSELKRRNPYFFFFFFPPSSLIRESKAYVTFRRLVKIKLLTGAKRVKDTQSKM